MTFEQYYRTPLLHQPWKTFVKESYEAPENPKKKLYELQFKGDEAKAAYDEIISDVNVACTVIETCATVKTKPLRHQNSSTTKLSSVTNARHDVSERITRFSVNTILKAVEQRDLNFLKKHLTSESVNLADSFGWTPLMSAAYCGYSEVVQFLLSLGANKRAREKSGLTAAQLALKRNYLEIVAILRKNFSTSNKNHSDNEAFSSVVSNVKCKELCSRSNHQDKCSPSNNVQNDSIDITQKHQRTSFYCEICKMEFHETPWEKHETSTLHIFNTKPKLPSTMYGISKQNKGYKMLLNTGWDEDQGLGPAGQGMKYPIKTSLKLDRKGIGQPIEKEPRVTHSEVHDKNLTMSVRISKRKPLKKKDREKLLSREAKKEKALRLALS